MVVPGTTGTRGGSRNYSEGCSNKRLRNQGCCYAQTLNPLLIGHNEMKVCHKLKRLDALILFSSFLLHFDQNSELWLRLFMPIERNLQLSPTYIHLGYKSIETVVKYDMVARSGQRPKPKNFQNKVYFLTFCSHL